MLLDKLSIRGRILRSGKNIRGKKQQKSLNKKIWLTDCKRPHLNYDLGNTAYYTKLLYIGMSVLIHGTF